MDPDKVRFASEMCTKLGRYRKLLAYSNVFSYYSFDSENMGSISLHSAALENKVLELHLHLTETLLSCADIQSAVENLTPQQMLTGNMIIKQV